MTPTKRVSELQAGDVMMRHGRAFTVVSIVPDSNGQFIVRTMATGQKTGAMSVASMPGERLVEIEGGR